MDILILLILIVIVAIVGIGVVFWAISNPSQSPGLLIGIGGTVLVVSIILIPLIKMVWG